MHRSLFPVLIWLLACMSAPTAVQAQDGNDPFLAYRKAPSILVPEHAPGMCLDFDLNQPWVNTHLWECWPSWNQAFAFKGQGNKGQIWLGGERCLSSQRGNGLRVSMLECDNSPAQVWTVNGNQIRDIDGRCLDVYGAGRGNGTWVITYDCVAGAANQRWRFTTLRAELKQAGITSPRIVPPGMKGDRPIGYERLPEFLELDRPRFTPRAITGAERKEIDRLVAPYRSIDVVRYIHYNGRPNWSGIKVPYSVLQRLMQLAETGDRYAMDQLLRMMRLALMIGESNGIDFGRSRYDPVDTDSPMGSDQALAWVRLHHLTRVWAAHRWARHGPDRLAAFAFTECYPSHGRCGYLYDIDRTKEGGNLSEWALTGKGKFFQPISNIRFIPVDTGPVGRLQRFHFLLGELRWTEQGRNRRLTEEDYYWMAGFARSAGFQEVYENAWMLASMNDARYWHPSERTFENARRDQQRKDDWEAAFARPIQSRDAQIKLLQSARSLGPSYVVRFASKYDLEDRSDLQLICNMNSPDCERQAAALQAMWARNARMAEEAEARRQAVNNFGTGKVTNSTVTVRNYDQNGNYTGSTVTTRTDAVLQGAKPQ